MRQYYTLVQPFSNEEERQLGEYLSKQGIRYKLGAEFASEFRLHPNSYHPGAPDPLLKKYIVLIDEHELSAIKLSVGKVTIVENRPFINLTNKFRKHLSWFYSELKWHIIE